MGSKEYATTVGGIKGGKRMTQQTNGMPELKIKLDDLDVMRYDKRLNGNRLTFDCFNTRERGDRVCCVKHPLSSNTLDEMMPLLAVLRGRTSSRCLKCPDFEGEEIA